MSDESISLNKYISSKGLCSRREADVWIDAGRVKINGKVARKGNRVFPKDKVTVDGENVEHELPKSIYLAFNKPPGITCTTDERDIDNIIDYIGYPERIFPIGRLDKASSGLIFLTNDGEIVNKILRARYYHEKEYIVKVDKPITARFLSRMSKGVPILGTVTRSCKIEQVSNYVFKIILTQGLNRQIRRMCEFLDYKVLSLKRVRIMNIEIDDLPVGKWRKLKGQELKSLKEELENQEDDPTQDAPSTRPKPKLFKPKKKTFIVQKERSGQQEFRPKKKKYSDSKSKYSSKFDQKEGKSERSFEPRSRSKFGGEREDREEGRGFKSNSKFKSDKGSYSKSYKKDYKSKSDRGDREEGRGFKSNSKFKSDKGSYSKSYKKDYKSKSDRGDREEGRGFKSRSYSKFGSNKEGSSRSYGKDYRSDRGEDSGDKEFKPKAAKPKVYKPKKQVYIKSNRKTYIPEKQHKAKPGFRVDSKKKFGGGGSKPFKNKSKSKKK
ncbi:MAG: 23S rRNA pseudouridine(2604) synthase RluF [Saprospiraceae bacterium]|nr:23S rRNA pseudouridine(2604) synthase RluF [Saprospiraceae bacterium]